MTKYFNVNFLLLLLVSIFLQPQCMKIGSAGKGATPQTENSGSVPALGTDFGLSIGTQNNKGDAYTFDNLTAGNGLFC